MRRRSSAMTAPCTHKPWTSITASGSAMRSVVVLDAAAFEARDRHGFQMSNVPPETHAPHPLAIAEPVETGIEERHRARCIERHAVCRAIERVEHETVRDHRNVAVVMALGDLGQARETAQVKFTRALAARYDVIGIPALEALPFLRVAFAHLGIGKPLENAEATLAQAGIGDDVVSRALRDRVRRVPCAHEIAAVEGNEGAAGEALCERSRLRATDLRQHRIGLALHAALAVPQRFGV